MQDILIKSFLSLSELIYPRLCAACEERLFADEKIICLNCEINLPQTHFHTLEERDNPMLKKFWGRVGIDNATALYYFTSLGKVQSLIHNLKYHNQPKVGEKLGNILGYYLKQTPQFSKVDYIVPVPLHKKKKQQRGYNQAEHLAIGVANGLNIPYTIQLLKKVTDTVTQTRKSRWERWQNVSTTFTVPTDQITTLRNKHILLVDDVMTTGATLEACAEKLLAIEGVKVSVATIAYAGE